MFNLNNLVNNIKNYVLDPNNIDLKKLNNSIQSIEDDYVNIKNFKLKRSKSCDSIFTKQKNNIINEIEMNNQLDIMKNKIQKIQNNLEEYTKKQNDIITDRCLFLFKHTGVTILLSSIMYGWFYYKC